MKIVIDITEEDYKKATDHLKIFNEKALNEPFMNATLRDRVEIALLRGTPLPKGHGRLIDKIRAEIEDLDIFYDNDYFSTNNCPMYKCNEVLLIIDKYKAESEEEE